MDLEKLFKIYLQKDKIYSDAVVFDGSGEIVNAQEISGRLGAVKKAHKKFMKAFRLENGNDINELLAWQNARI